MYCWKCGAKAVESTSFCMSCGATFTAAAQTGVGSHPAKMETFPVWLLVLLHYVTLGIFSIVWINLYHGKLPRTRTDDPTGGRAVGFLFIPFYSLYWVFFTHLRLCERLDGELVKYGLHPTQLKGLVLTLCIIHVIPYVGGVSYLILYPITAGLLQTRFNELADAIRVRPACDAPAAVQTTPADGWCAACMKENPTNSRFCAFCGAELTALEIS